MQEAVLGRIAHRDAVTKQVTHHLQEPTVQRSPQGDQENAGTALASNSKQLDLPECQGRRTQKPPIKAADYSNSDLLQTTFTLLLCMHAADDSRRPPHNYCSM